MGGAAARLVIMGVLGALLGGGCGGDGDSADAGREADGAGADDGAPAPDLGAVDGSSGDGGPATGCRDDDGCTDGYYCLKAPGDLEGTCTPGCRIEPDSCVELYLCDPETRACVLDPACEDDDRCGPDEYCGPQKVCVPGCRTGEPERCPADAEGRPQACDARTRACVPLVVCCGAEEACAMVRSEACADPVPAATRCFNPNPCAGRCPAGDLQCPAEAWCDPVEQRCKPGCRPGTPGTCPPETACNPETHICERRPCPGGDGDCLATQYCEPVERVCIRGCRRDPDNCPAGTSCNASRQCGEGCENDAICVARNGEGWYCTVDGCQRPCAVNADCAADQVCLAGTRRCGPGCRDDALEPNDDAERASALVFADGVRYESPEALIACTQNRDWFRFDVPQPGWAVQAAVRFRHADGDLDARLYDPAGNVVARGESATDDEVLALPQGYVAPAGTWRLEVYSRGRATNRYRLQVTLTPAAGCVDDAAEGGVGDDEPALGTRLSLPEQRQQIDVQGRWICADDADWFTVRMGARDGLRVELTLHGNGFAMNDDLTFGIWGPAAPGGGDPPVFEPNAAAGGVNGPRVLIFDAPRNNAGIVDGTYYIQVSGLDEAQYGRYDLRVAVDREVALCVDDAAEPNDARANAYDLLVAPGFTRPRLDGLGREIVPGQDLNLRNLWLCRGEEDWYRLELAQGDTLEASVVRPEQDLRGDTRIEIRRPNGTLVGLAGRSGQPVNTARAQNLGAGVYYVWVGGVADTQTRYDLRIHRTALAVACPRDRFEQDGNNDERARARLLMPGRHADLTLCGADGDRDWFQFESDALADITVTARFRHAQGDLELDVFRADNVLAENAGLPDGHSADDDEVVRLRNRAPDRYFVLVRGLGDPSVSYELEIQVTPRVFVCADDPDERNDRFDEAVSLGQGLLDRASQWICERQPRDEDWFQIEVPAGRTRTVATTFLFGDDGDLYLEIYDEARMLRAGTSGIARGNSKQCAVILPEARHRVFYLRVAALSINTVQSDDERLDYRIRVLEGDACAAVPPDTPGVNWPRVE